MAVRIVCIKRDDGAFENPYLSIDHLEWVNERININGITDRSKIYDWIKNKNGEAYVINKSGDKIYLIAATCPKGNKYVKTGDDETRDYLLQLPGCA